MSLSVSRPPALRRPVAAVAAAAVLAVLLPLAGCSGGAGSTGQASSVVSAAPVEFDHDAAFVAIERLLAARAEAVQRGDRARFLATLDPDNPRLRASQAALFDNLQQLPLDKVYYGVNRTGLEPARVRGADPLLRPRVFEHVELSRVMTKPVSNELAMTFVRRDGRWLVGAEGNDPDFAAQARPWFGGRIEAAGDDDLVVLTDRDADVGAAELLTRTRSSLDAVAAVLDLPADERLLVDATSNGAPVQVNQSSEEAGAVTTGLFATSPDGRTDQGLAGTLVKANPTHVRQLVEDTRTLRHELTHVVLDGYFGTNPLWVTEGIAEYVGSAPALLATSRTDSAALVRGIRERPVELTEAGDWGADPALDYLSARAFTEYLVTRYGIDRYLDMMNLLRRLAIRRNTMLGQSGILEEVLRRVYDTTPEVVARGGFDLLEGLSAA